MTAPRYLLDTNMLSELIRRPAGDVAQRLAAVGEHAVCTSIVVSCELRFGAAKSGSARLRRRVDAILSALPVLPLEAPADRHYARLRAHLAQRGTPIGPNDLLIAAHARSLSLAVVTADEAEFRRVPGLAVENWLS
ncbi:MAG: type II toxin-antitoxin system VapC family toxin [Gammaproteobacteria bacterium]